MLFVVFPLLFLIFYLCLYFCQFDYFVSQCAPPWLHHAWDSLCFLDLVDYFLSHVREVFSYYRFKYFLGSLFSLSSSSETNLGFSLLSQILAPLLQTNTGQESITQTQKPPKLNLTITYYRTKQYPDEIKAKINQNSNDHHHHHINPAPPNYHRSTTTTNFNI